MGPHAHRFNVGEAGYWQKSGLFAAEKNRAAFRQHSPA